MVNQKPIMKIIKVVDAGSSREIERIAIKKAISLGWPLMNHEHVFPKGYFNRTKSFQSAYSSIREELLRFC